MRMHATWCFCNIPGRYISHVSKVTHTITMETLYSLGVTEKPHDEGKRQMHDSL